jgi:hypothetical protein
MCQQVHPVQGRQHDEQQGRYQDLQCAQEPQPGDYLSIKRENWTLDTMRDLYETVITNYNNTRTEVAWNYEGMQEMGSKVTDIPGNKSDWITDEMHTMVFTVSVTR